MLNNILIKSRLYLLGSVMAAFLIIVGAIGLYSMSQTISSLKSVYEDRTVALADLTKVDRLIASNANEILRAFQHNPSYEISRLHDHPVNEHLARIEQNVPVVTEAWNHYMSTYLTPEEAGLAREYERLRKEWLNKILLPTMHAIGKGDYSREMAARYLEGARTISKPMNETMKKLVELQIREAKSAYEHASSTYETVRFISIAAIVGGLMIGLLVAWRIIRSITIPLEHMRSTIVSIEKSNDFTLRISNNSSDEVGQTARAFNALAAKLQDALRQVRDSAQQLTSSAQSLSNSSSQVSTSSELQSEATSSMAAAVEQVTVSINHVSDNARYALEMARKSGTLSIDGAALIQQVAAEMEKLATVVRTTSSVIEDLGQHSAQISSIVNVIRDVADQTNLLALNAAIEAARAGEQGRGFAVVADEVRKLAEKTTSATGEIERMIGAIQQSAQTAVTTMGNAVNQVGGEVALAKQAGSTIIEIRDSSEKVVNVVNDISSALVEQSTASNDIAGQVEKVAQMTEENSAAAGETATTATQLNKLADSMQASVNRFRI